MYYKAFTDNPIERYRVTWFSDDRSPGEMGAALAMEGYVLVVRGEVIWGGANLGGVITHSFDFTPKGQTVLLAEHVIRIDVVNEIDPDI